MKSIGILTDITDSELDIAVKAIQAERSRVSREQALKTACEKLEDLENFCKEHGIMITTPELEGRYHPTFQNLRGKIKLR